MSVTVAVVPIMNVIRGLPLLKVNLNGAFNMNSIQIENSNQDEKELRKYISLIEEFDDFIQTKDKTEDSKKWNSEFESYVNRAYLHINGWNGFSESCDSYPVKNPLIALGIDYMRCLTAAFNKTDDRVSSFKEGKGYDESY